MKNLKAMGYVIGLIVLIVGMAYAGWHIKRWFNYTFMYEDLVHEQVQEEIQPLKERIKELERLVKEK